MLSRQLVEVVHYYFGKNKEEFQREEDSYANWVLLAAEEGAFSYGCGREQGQVKDGEFILCPPGIILKRKVNRLLSYHFAEFIWRDEFGEAVSPGSGVPYGKISIPDRGRLYSDYSYMRQTQTVSSPSGKNELVHFIRDLLMLAAYSQSGQTESVKARDKLMQQVAEYIQANASAKLKLEEVAILHGLKPYQLTKRFRAAYGKPPVSFLNSIRLHRAKELLLETDRTIEDIAELCGYQNGYYLSRIFTVKTGISPSAYRKAHRV